ncbi:MAG: hypothetical protein GX858_07605 [Clostridiales bacterium]|nr:hypothetical protein [Clostridiales bacterium]
MDSVTGTIIRDRVDIISKKYHITMPTYGHAGDGNLHTTLVKNPDSTMEKWYEAEDKILVELYEVVRSLGGKISGEHGIGIKRKKYMEWLTDPVEMKLMKRIKQAFDPYNIMNPGKMFD